MKRLVIFLLIVAIAIAGSAYSKDRAKQFRIASGDATNPQTISFVTTYGMRASAWVVVAPDGGAMLKFKGLDGRANWWLYLPTGTSFQMKDGKYPVDSLTVLRDATTSGVWFSGLGGE